MRKGKSDIEKRPLGTPSAAAKKRVKIAIKPKTAENIIRMNQAVGRAKFELEEAQRELVNHTLPLLTERGLEAGIVVEVTEKAPHYLIIELPKK